MRRRTDPGGREGSCLLHTLPLITGALPVLTIERIWRVSVPNLVYPNGKEKLDNWEAADGTGCQ